MKKVNTSDFAKQIRIESLKMVYSAKASHIGGALSMADILAVLYNEILSYDPANPNWSKRDRFLLSKGHACVSLYATLALKGFFSDGCIRYIRSKWKFTFKSFES